MCLITIGLCCSPSVYTMRMKCAPPGDRGKGACPLCPPGPPSPAVPARIKLPRRPLGAGKPLRRVLLPAGLQVFLLQGRVGSLQLLEDLKPHQVRETCVPSPCELPPCRHRGQDRPWKGHGTQPGPAAASGPESLGEVSVGTLWSLPALAELSAIRLAPQRRGAEPRRQLPSTSPSWVEL